MAGHRAVASVTSDRARRRLPIASSPWSQQEIDKAVAVPITGVLNLANSAADRGRHLVETGANCLQDRRERPT